MKNENRKKKRKRKLNIKKTIRTLLVFTLIIGSTFFVGIFAKKIIVRDQLVYIASNTTEAKLYDKDFKEVKSIYRGEKININKEKIIKDNQEVLYYKVNIDKKEYYIKDENVVYKSDDVVKEKEIFVRTPSTILEDTESSRINGLAKKGEKLEVLGYDKINENGQVNIYNIKKDDVSGYIYGKYLVFTESDANKNYDAEKYDPIHSQIKNPYNGGNAIDLDFYPVEKPKFSDNVMPENVYSLYMNCGSNVINNVDAYIEFAKDTKINAFVVDIKDNQSPAYHSEVLKNLSPTNYQYAINENENYKNAIKKLKDAGFYVIGRITTFKDSYYVADHPEDAISSASSGKPYLHQGAYWPSPYSRNVWYYTIELAKEAVKEFGFNEIQFDYVRFPDRLQGVENTINMKNTYKEDKTQAIQRFLTYATDELHKLNVYVSADVFGESTNGTYTTAYGQYWPALSNVVDVMSGMPYPDHFSTGYYGLAKPWNSPYELMKAWGTDAYKRQSETTSPAVVRTWIQAYHVMEHVDPNGIDYNANEIKKQVTGLFDAGLTGGYITWLSSSNLDKYRLQKDAFKIDYAKGNN